MDPHILEDALNQTYEVTRSYLEGENLQFDENKVLCVYTIFGQIYSQIENDIDDPYEFA